MAAPRRTIPALLVLLLLLIGAAIGLVSRDDEAPAPDPGTAAEVDDAREEELPSTVRAIPERGRVDSDAAASEADDDSMPPEVETEETFEGPPTGQPLMRDVTVKVLREDGGPVRDARVTAFTTFGRVNVVPAEAATDVSGEATLLVSGGANFRVRAWTRDAAGISERVSLSPGEDGEVTVRLATGRAVAGVVTSSDGGLRRSARCRATRSRTNSS